MNPSSLKGEHAVRVSATDGGRFGFGTGPLSAYAKLSADCLHLTLREHANPLQFLVREVRLFLVAGAFYLPQS